MSAPAWLTARMDMNLAYLAGFPELVEYVGFAEPGAAKAEPKWSIFKLFYSNGGDSITELRWANNSRAMTFVWNERLLFTYDIV